VNTTLGNIKTAIAGTYHHVSAKHAQTYLTSFAYRFNQSWLGLFGQVFRLDRWSVCRVQAAAICGSRVK
jgi:ISXO2-like transposase domain